MGVDRDEIASGPVQTIFNPVMASYIKLNKDIIRHASEIYSYRDESGNKYSSQATIFHKILETDLPE
ncbi:uncharacterized protein Z518_01779 [Rhinocladiella mackenziei CBS 650.93]|uniref:Uncharacterized protein n=1 Tax=Rhinocladiella mackenziei CBS 650.93 TaxID=1442369 RepID=A0A0D2JMJ2_9EURO|nr:uncharacterized protein Z518_01779 [Rhinocladiella mackenziei CBS 650.93]KIX10695.1 hypothetical protein Z518_01779 [Rhinocladiella mackenziei CBS 650.93]